jgi:hypothetical protein
MELNMLRDVFECGWIDFKTLTDAVASVINFEPTILVTSHDTFLRYINVFSLHGEGKWVEIELRKLKIHRIIWGDYLKDNEFKLSSEESWKKLSDEDDIETLTLK